MSKKGLLGRRLGLAELVRNLKIKPEKGRRATWNVLWGQSRSTKRGPYTICLNMYELHMKLTNYCMKFAMSSALDKYVFRKAIKKSAIVTAKQPWTALALPWGYADTMEYEWELLPSWQLPPPQDSSEDSGNEQVPNFLSLWGVAGALYFPVQLVAQCKPLCLHSYHFINHRVSLYPTNSSMVASVHEVSPATPRPPPIPSLYSSFTFLKRTFHFSYHSLSHRP